ncbi:MAG: hypothetical protein MK105_18730 [Crocinitomicaceae bacterium]|nr:hypothetical protein [Crocinitomicaceae bacterium]
MKKLIQIFLFLTVHFAVYCQTEIPTKKELKKAKADTTLNVNILFENHTTWEEIGYYDYKANEYRISDSSRQVVFVNKKTVNYVTPSDKLEIKNNHEFKITYGGTGPEQQTFKILAVRGDYLILESKFVNKGYVNGKLAWKQKKKLRYIWKIKE